MTRIYIDPDHPSLTPNERRIVEYGNAGYSWSAMVEATGKARSTIKGTWANACRKVHGGTPQPVLDVRIEDPTIGNEQTMRGIPITGRGVGGTMKGTRPELVRLRGRGSGVARGWFGWWSRRRSSNSASKTWASRSMTWRTIAKGSSGSVARWRPTGPIASPTSRNVRALRSEGKP